jgi:ribosomal protein L16 Arg81 hydroxylase
MFGERSSSAPHIAATRKKKGKVQPLKRLCHALGTEFSARIQVNVYLTPAGNRGFKPHYDTHDVFIAQVHGTKDWQLYGSPIELPLRSQPHDKSLPEPTTPDVELQMRCGDLLYLPRGTIHAATANDTTSVHLTIGVHPILWSEVISDAAARVFATDARFRRSLPIGFARSPHLRRHDDRR